MQRQSLMRGLAVSAVAALAVTGLATTAHAETASPVSPTLISQFSGKASVRYDGAFLSNTMSVRLTARVDPSATAVFEYNVDPDASDEADGWAVVDGAVLTPDAGGYVTGSWSAAALAGRTVAVRVAATLGVGEEAVTSYATRRDVKVTGQSSPTNSVLLTTSAQGYFPQPYVSAGHTATLAAVLGTTSASDGDVALSWWRASDGTFQGRTDAAVSPTAFKASFDPGDLPSLPSPTGSSVPGGFFSGALDISAFDAQDGPDGAILAIAARRDSDDVLPVTLHEQTISHISFDAFGDPTPDGTPAILSVSDENGAPVAGAQVRRLPDNALVGYTDGAGHVSALQPAASTVTYYANAADDATFDAPDDVKTTTGATPAYAPEATSTVARLADGSAFDSDEYAAGDVALQIVDQKGAPYASASQVSYSLYRTGSTPTAPVTATADATGRVVIPVNAAMAGSYTLDYTTPNEARVDHRLRTTFTVGDSVLTLAAGVASAPSGGRMTYVGSLSVGGKPMPGRTIDLSYARGHELAPGRLADAGIGAARALTGTTTTNALGQFSVTVQDQAEAGNPSESGRLTAVSSNAHESAPAGTQFGPGRTTVVVGLGGAGRGARADRVKVAAPVAVAGKVVVLFRKVHGHRWVRVAAHKLNRRGVAKLTVADHNGTARTRYRAVLRGGVTVKRSTSDVLELS
ncbi:hypothetical protein SAMN04487968_107129 [Nocardioides terrae]|uniref:Ig-like domain (Group 1) n=1 Tax=Nocardioides terrae TaxID=574651 RepID=A0A1I1JS89_9ACTN|nr:hypothetical protein [Nocardioides terrae]SFC51434.1 hypothetical protein SAMN04487968_107129 [Nocardioides terrae]